MSGPRRLLGAPAATIAAAPLAARAQSLTPRVLAGVPEDSITPVLYGMRSGIFRKYGSHVKLESERSGPAITSAVAGGTYQLGKASIFAACSHMRRIYRSRSSPAGIYNAAQPIDGMFVRADSPYKTAADLNGKTFGVYGIGDIFTISTKRGWEKTASIRRRSN